MRTTRPAHRFGRSRSAFTLIEILVVVAIIGVAGALVVPSMLSAGTLGLQGAARLMVADMQYAQNEAVASGAERGIEFDPVTNRYRMFDENGVTLDLKWMRTGGRADQLDASGDVLVPGWTVDFTTDNRFEGVDLVAANFNGTQRLRFDELGAPVGGTANGSLMIRNADHRIVIEIDGFTGRVSVR